MPIPQHLRIINTTVPGASGSSRFIRFPLLPAELQLQIWRCFLSERQRLLGIKLECRTPLSEQDSSPDLSHMICGQSYTATVSGHGLFSKLLRVNRQARHAVLDFYRVHIPCKLASTNTYLDPTSATLYLNPEHDFIHWTDGDGDAFVDFLHDLKAYDPRNLGLLNIALGWNQVNNLLDVPLPLAKATFFESLTQLREIIWVAHSRTGRAIFGASQGFPAHVGVRFNHSMPIKGASPSFHLLPRDPRPVSPELSYVLTACSHPRSTRQVWQALLARWKIGYDGTTMEGRSPPRERYLFALEPSQHVHVIRDRNSAYMYLRDEEEDWLRLEHRSISDFRRFAMKAAGQTTVESPEEFKKAVRPAIGFWLFPVEALGPLDEQTPDGMKIVFDMTDHWPELALACI